MRAAVHSLAMTAFAVDTHAFIKRLTASGMPEAQAETITSLVKEAQETSLGDLATKTDLVSLKGDMRAEIEPVKLEMAGLKAELGVVKWMVGGIGFGVLLLVLKSFWPA